MAYCGFSCCRWTSDVYAYRNVESRFVVHVAGERMVGAVPVVPDLAAVASGAVTAEVRLAAHRAETEFLETARHEPITLAHAGKPFTEDSRAARVARLLVLRALGFMVPEHAFVRLANEADYPETRPTEGGS